MKSTIPIQALLCSVFLGGCIPLAQTELYPTSKSFGAHIDQRKFLAVAFQADSPKLAKTKILDTKNSYVISPQGKTYSVDIEYNDYANTVDSYWKQGAVYTTTPKRFKNWGNGLWTLHFAFLPPNRFTDVDAKIKVWTLYYNPLLHGAPN